LWKSLRVIPSPFKNRWAAEMPRLVLVTGCSEGGIGDAIAQEFHRKGYHVFAKARKLKKIQHLKALGLDVVKLDVTLSSSVDLAVEHICKELGEHLTFLLITWDWVSRTNVHRCLTTETNHTNICHPYYLRIL
jgi:NAD(P)-dependent dehydrogenase (short-subunit alcohol dehydrogenase family)